MKSNPVKPKVDKSRELRKPLILLTVIGLYLILL
jgi:hypothetical protein